MPAFVNRLITCLKTLSAPQSGQTNVELGAILVLVSIVSIALLQSVGTNVITLLSPLTGGFWGV